MRYNAIIFIGPTLIGTIRYDRYELVKPGYMQFYLDNDSIVGHVEPLGRLGARVDIYTKADDERIERWDLFKSYTFRHRNLDIFDRGIVLKHKELKTG